MTRAWGLLLRLYPDKHRAEYADEMRHVIEQAAEEERQRGFVPYVRFLIAEAIGLLGGSAGQWLDVIGHRRYSPEIAEASSGLDIPDDITALELRIAANLRRMEYAIAHHQFTRARFFSEVDLRQREALKHLRSGTPKVD